MSATQAIWHPGVTLEFFNSIRPGTMPEYLEIVFTEVGPDYLKATMPVSERTCQPMRVLHGGASVVLAETLASTAGNATIDIGRFSLLGQEINANHLRPVPFGSLVTGVTRPVHIGARSQVWSTEILDERGRLACISRMTLALVERPLRAAAAA